MFGKYGTITAIPWGISILYFKIKKVLMESAGQLRYK
jgi:hypothetical protein